MTNLFSFNRICTSRNHYLNKRSNLFKQFGINCVLFRNTDGKLCYNISFYFCDKDRHKTPFTCYMSCQRTRNESPVTWQVIDGVWFEWNFLYVSTKIFIFPFFLFHFFLTYTYIYWQIYIDAWPNNVVFGYMFYEI